MNLTLRRGNHYAPASHDYGVTTIGGSCPVYDYTRETGLLTITAENYTLTISLGASSTDHMDIYNYLDITTHAYLFL